MAIRYFATKEPAPSPTRRWWLSLYYRLSAATKRSLLLLSLSAALLVNGQLQIANQKRVTALPQAIPPHAPYSLPAVPSTLLQLNLPLRDPIGDQFQVNTYTTNFQRLAAVALDNDGDFVVVWQSAGSSGGDISSYSIQAQRYNSNGTAQGSEFQVNSYTTGGQRFPAVAMDSDGDFVVAWASAGSSSGDISDYSIQAQRYNSVGTPQGSQFQVNSYTTEAQRIPAVAMDSDGDFVVVWESNGSSGDNDSYSIQAQRYNSAGTPQGSQFQVNNVTLDVQQLPVVALDSDGDFVVVWESYTSSGSDNSYTSIQGRSYNSSGTAQGNQFQVNSYTTGGQHVPAAAMDSVGDFVVAWESSDSSGTDHSGYSVQGQRFSADGPILTPTPTAGPPTDDVYLPAIIGQEFPYFDGPCEAEPNDSAAQANGYLRSGQSYCGYPNDNKDFFAFYLFTAGTITADLTNHTGEGVQLQLFYQSTDNLVAFDTGLGPLQVEHNGPAGLYYLYIYTNSGFNNNTLYSLVVNYP